MEMCRNLGLMIELFWYFTLVAQTSIAVDFNSGLLSSRACALSHLALFSMNRVYISGQDAPGYEPELSWRFGDSPFMRQWLNTQALLFRSTLFKWTLVLVVFMSPDRWRNVETFGLQTDGDLRFPETLSCVENLGLQTEGIIFRPYGSWQKDFCSDIRSFAETLGLLTQPVMW